MKQIGHIQCGPHLHSPRQLRVVLYARVNGRDAERLRSLAVQLDTLRRRAGRERWVAVGEFVDSGGKGDTDRPGLSRVLIDARHGRYDILLVYALDRLARAIREAAHVFDELDQAGVLIVSTTDVVDATSLGNGTWPFIRVDTVARQGSEVLILAESPARRSWRKR